MIRIFRHYISGVYFILLWLEFAVFLSALYAGFSVRFFEDLPENFGFQLTVSSIFFAMIMTGSMTGMGLYQRSHGRSEAGIFLQVLASFMLGTILMSLMFYAVPDIFLGRGVFGYALMYAFGGVLLLRFIFIRRVDKNQLKRRILVLGAGANARKIAELEAKAHGFTDSFMVIGFLPLEATSTPLIPPDKLIAFEGGLNDLALGLDADEIVVAPDDRRKQLPVHEILDCKISGTEVIDLLTFFEREAGLIRVENLHPSWLVFSDGFKLSGMRAIFKRVFDISASVALLFFAWPVTLFAALAIYVESGRPIFYRQVRVGKDLKTFSVLKFRSMRVDAERDGKAVFAQKNDARVTRVGKFIRKCRIDELPQLFNVLVGDMSFVGPRPERPQFVERYSETIPFYSERHRVKPGITGWAQLCYPYGVSDEDTVAKLEYDLYYVKNYSLFLDFLIMLQTIEVVLWGKGAQ